MALMWHLGQVSTFKECLVALTWTTVSFWIEILYLSLTKTKVVSAIQNESHKTKNKRVKP
jgi:hypothetical protein